MGMLIYHHHHKYTDLKTLYEYVHHFPFRDGSIDDFKTKSYDIPYLLIIAFFSMLLDANTAE
jgi:hypothetical protein